MEENLYKSRGRLYRVVGCVWSADITGKLGTSSRRLVGGGEAGQLLL